MSASPVRHPNAPPVISLPVAPHSIDSEQAVLGGLLIDNGAFDKIGDVVTEGDFYRDDHRRIFRHIARLIKAGQPTDALTVHEAIAASEDKDKTGGLSYLAALAGNTPSAHNVRRYGEIVAEHAQRRAIMSATAELGVRAAHGDLEDCYTELSERVAAIRPKGAEWVELDLRALALREPAAPRHIIADWLPAGEVTLFAGHGGAGKSLFALYVAACIALGLRCCGIATERRQVRFVSAEDRADILHWRLARVAAHLGTTLDALGEQLRVTDASAIDAELMVELDGVPTVTPAYESLRAQMRDAQVLVLDGASDLYGASEIIRRHVRKYVRSLRRLVDEDGAVLLLAHVDKAAARDSAATDRYSGSTAWHNSVRSRWALAAEPDGGAMLLTLAKANHARAGAEIRLRWDTAAHLYLAESSPIDGGVVGAIRDRQEREGIIAAMRACAAAGIIVPAAMQGPRTTYHALLARPELPESLRSGPGAARRFRARIEELRHIPAFEEREMRRGNRHYTLGLVLTDIGSAPHAPDSGK